jgi:LPXTG-motif cell wall-anchored protein
MAPTTGGGLNGAPSLVGMVLGTFFFIYIKKKKDFSLLDFSFYIEYNKKYYFKVM